MKRLKRHKVAIDTNVIISGLFFGGNPGRIISLVRSKKIIWCISPETSAELVEKISHFTTDDEFIALSIAFIEIFCLRILPTTHTDICRDERDNMFLDLAKEGDCEYIITGDKDLLGLKIWEKTKIVTPREFIDIWQHG